MNPLIFISVAILFFSLMISCKKNVEQTIAEIDLTNPSSTVKCILGATGLEEANTIDILF
jgi:hypothetical protein